MDFDEARSNWDEQAAYAAGSLADAKQALSFEEFKGHLEDVIEAARSWLDVVEEALEAGD